MTIKEFAHLCGCNPQTLRFYDHENLLKPVKVDEWSGYRYYDKNQALVYVKIKNLQKAGFSINEIKGLLEADNQVIFDAFSAKIAEQEEKLAEIRKIQLSYQSEMSDMSKKLEMMRAFIMKTMQDYDPSEEFGLNQESYQEMISQADEYFSASLDGMEDRGFEYDDEDEEGEFVDFLDNPEYEVIDEKHNWSLVKDFFRELSSLENNCEYALLFRMVPGKAAGAAGAAFASTALGMLLKLNPDKHITLSCNVRDNSTDGKNHFWLLRKKK